MTPADFIDGKGGPAEMARAISARTASSKITPGAIALWRHRNKIPRSAWPELMETYDDVSLARLKEIEAARPSGRKAA